MWNARLCQNRLLLSAGSDTERQLPFVVPVYPKPLGQLTLMPVIEVIMFGVLLVVTRPAGWAMWGAAPPGQLITSGCAGSLVQPGGGEAPVGAASALNSTPADAVVSLE